ncbi:type II toxin-antitoxin system RelE/ParE family toxin [Aminobacter sp. AP02]|uniref:type II toxin-antitoxin system RelE/ParE family toxin n=1 Tax=Aminobacter sp. AP02 TaxID=2135737 RepID=UPI000D6D7A1B|nr:type II toxin-antitoxin system RelE/ParE family toxin [Aminobacter sp. AP02]
MTERAVIPRALARLNIEDALDHYGQQAGVNAALGFVDDLQKAYALIADQPASGLLRYAYELGLPGLRTVRLKRHPYVIFYSEQADHIDVWRILHGKRDIPAWLQNSAD